jgi:hypothetical protein
MFNPIFNKQLILFFILSLGEGCGKNGKEVGEK